MLSLAELGALAADVVARAIARGVYEARALPFPGALPSWKDKFGSNDRGRPSCGAPEAVCAHKRLWARRVDREKQIRAMHPR